MKPKQFLFFRYQSDESKLKFGLLHYVSIMSFAYNHPDYKIVLAVNHEFLESAWYLQLNHDLQGLEIKVLGDEIPKDFKYIQHYADYFSTKYIYENGGAYFDLDFICLKPLNAFFECENTIRSFEHNFHGSQEGTITGLSTEVIANPGDENIGALLKMYDDDIAIAGSGWRGLSVEYPYELYKQNPSKTTIISEFMMEPISWNKEELRDLYLHKVNLNGAFTLHCSESVSIDYLKNIDLEHVMTVDTTFTLAARPYVQHLWDNGHAVNPALTKTFM